MAAIGGKAAVTRASQGGQSFFGAEALATLRDPVLEPAVEAFQSRLVT
jgi:hypothetical protein